MLKSMRLKRMPCKFVFTRHINIYAIYGLKNILNLFRITSSISLILQTFLILFPKITRIFSSSLSMFFDKAISISCKEFMLCVNGDR